MLEGDVEGAGNVSCIDDSAAVAKTFRMLKLLVTTWCFAEPARFLIAVGLLTLEAPRKPTMRRLTCSLTTAIVG